MLKLIDKFLKALNTDRNTFVTYILTLFTIYFVVDRIVEILFMFFTGMSVSYWGPIMYTFALACPVFAFYFSGCSKFIKNDDTKISFFYLYCIALYIIGISMLIQWLNTLGWVLITAVPNYSFIAANFPELIGPAFKSLAIYIPVLTVPALFRFLYMNVNDSKDLKDSILDYPGINLADTSVGTGPYTCEIVLCKDSNTAKPIKIPENRRYEVSLIVGVSGSGKTSMVFEPMMARDIERKFFFRAVSKEMGYTALKNGVATLNCPYTNEYINENFSLNMLIPNPYKENVYKEYMKNLILDSAGDKITYRDLGLTFLSPDYESLSHIMNVAHNFNFHVNLIDPNNENSIGLNPFIYDDPTKTAIVVSSVLRGMYKSISLDTDEVYKENVAMQAVENLSILLKEMYPRINDGLLPNLEDMLKMLNNFDLVEEMCELLQQDEGLAEKYSIQISYFKRHFYKNSSGRAETERNVYLAIAQLYNLLRYQGVKNILCNRSNNINFDKALANGEITLACTRRGDLGATAHKAFGLFFILLMQHSVLSRPGNEKNRVPHFLYIDEFANFVCEATTPIFTLYRKYRVGSIISSQNLSQFGTPDGDNFRQTILANCTTKIIFGNNTPEDNEWWEKELGDKRRWTFTHDYHSDQLKYDDNYKSIKWQWISNYKAGKVQSLKFKYIIYKTKDMKGKNIVGQAKIDFLEARYKEKQKIKTYNFGKYSNGNSISNSHSELSNKFDLKNINFNSNPNNPNDMDPIQTNNSDLSYKFDNEDAITSYNSNNNKKN